MKTEMKTTLFSDHISNHARFSFVFSMDFKVF